MKINAGPLLDALHQTDMPAQARPLLLKKLKEHPNLYFCMSSFSVSPPADENDCAQVVASFKCRVDLYQYTTSVSGQLTVGFTLTADLNAGDPAEPLAYHFPLDVAPQCTFSQPTSDPLYMRDDDQSDYGTVPPLPDVSDDELAGFMVNLALSRLPETTEDAEIYLEQGDIGLFGFYVTCRVPRTDQPDLLFDGTHLQEVSEQTNEKTIVTLALYHTRKSGYVAHRQTETGNRKRLASGHLNCFSVHEGFVAESPEAMIEALGFGDAEKALYEAMAWETAQRI
ncbi:hypothetical protein VRRI112168_02845 [Vreelandella rituensis]|uniref:Uncharacterized protein n=2 Tax=Vreelandella rituensis TaxID=2282306 RepID=A0A368UBG7_9GAMM|nr:hypothetical protein DU506_00565 [Halomonas rituensis]